jgi:hypothetical protein
MLKIGDIVKLGKSVYTSSAWRDNIGKTFKIIGISSDYYILNIGDGENELGNKFLDSELKLLNTFIW